MQNYRSNSNYSRGGSYVRPLDVSYNEPNKDFYSEKDEDNLAKLPLAMAYVPWQTWGEKFAIDEVLNKGTLFPELYKPFLGAGGKR